MKNTLKLILFVLLAFGMMACGEKKLTQEDLIKAEQTLMENGGNLDKETASAVVEKYCQFVKQNPDDASAPEWLFKALRIEVKLGESEKAIALCDQLVKDYPTHETVPAALMLMASDVYDSQLHDLDKARAMYEKVISDYPDSEWTDSAEKMIGFLGLTPDEILAKIRQSNNGEEEGEN